MDTCYFRIRYITLMFYWMDFNSVVIHSIPFTSVAAGRSDTDTGDWPFSTVERREPRTPPLSLKPPGDLRLAWASTHPRNRQLKQLAFSRSLYSFQVTEDTPPGTPVGRVSAAHTGGRGPVVFSVLEDDGDGVFLLSPRSGEFFLSRGLDYETERFYGLLVGVRRGDGQLSSARVYFSVVDVNDNPPVPTPEAYSVSVLENSPPGTCILTLNVSDADDGVNAELSWAVIAGDEEAKFAVNVGGVVCLQGALDREKVSVYNLTIRVSDLALPHSSRLTGTALVAVLVQDVNDNGPYFTSPEVLRIREDAPLHAVVMVIHAADADAGRNGEVEYGLEGPSGGTFRIDGARGRLFLEEPLDRESADALAVVVTARDRGSPPRYASVNLTVLVDDVNDNDPAFPWSARGATAREDVPRGTSLLQVRARDPDVGPNGRVRYQLSHSHFAVDPVRGVVVATGRLDREKSPSYSFAVVAVDQGDPPRSATVSVNVTLSDVNDCAPLFTPQSISLHVQENSPDLPRVIHQVSALDEDLGMNSQLTYSITRGNEEGLFSLSPGGTLRVLHSLDREQRTQHMLHIMAVDSGIPPLTGTATALIHVDDLNDNRPLFPQGVISAVVAEDVPVGTVIATVTAFDPDHGANGEVRYALEEGSAPFSIDEVSGAVLTTGALDRESVGSYLLTVTGSDLHPTHPLLSAAVVSVLVRDVNDHRPRFLNSPYVANVPSTVAAVDADMGRNAQLTFSMFGHNSSQLSISPARGEIFTSDVLSGAEDITVGVRVEDGGDDPKDDITTVTVRFQNASEFPVVTVDTRRPLISEDEPLNTLVAVVTGESNRTELISYYLASGHFGEVFQLHPETGELTISSPLDYEANQEFLIWVEARDAGLPPFSSYAEIHINISDVNDNSPVFTQSVYRCETLENSLAGPVCGVSAVDADSGVYGKVQYSILSGNADNTFTIDSDTGILGTVKSLDREKISDYNLTIQAADKENDVNTDTAVVLVVVLDVNDNAPRFSQIFFTEIPEDTPVGFTAIQITSTDEDIGVNAVIVYTVIDQSGSLPFALDGASGNLVVVRLLDRETQDRYVVKVNANDSAWSISTDVIIEITDVNDNRPVFSQSLYYATITETKTQEVFVMQVHATDSDLGSNKQILYYIDPASDFFGVNISTVPEDLPLGSVIGKIQAEDEDDGANGLLHYSLESGNEDTIFSIGQNTGLITLIRGLDSERQGAHFLQVSSQDGGWIPKDANDPPEFSAVFYTAEVSEDAALGTSVTRVTAKDKDLIPEWSRFVYSITSGNENSSFALDPVTGIVSVGALLDREQWPLYNLTVVAIDGAFPPATGSASVVVSVTDVNDNPPRLISATGYVRENQPYGTVVSVLKASDADLPSNGGPFTYWLVRPTFGSAFLLSAEGVLSTTRPVDRERNPVHSVLVVVQDAGSPPLSSTATVRVEVLDENDNPSAPRHIYIEVKYYGSTFQGGLIGNVQPEDPDDLDLFNCSIRSGPGNMFSFPFGGCDLWSTPYQGETTYNITVEASDQLHPSVNNSIYVSYKGFTNASMDNCVLFYVTSPSFKEFLSFSYLKFVKALDSLFNLQASKTHVFGIKILGDKILLLAAVKSYNGQFLSGDVASDISAAHKRSLEAQSGVEISDITGDPCSVNPCHHGATCTKNIHISQDIAVLESPALMFVSPKKVEIFKCSCLPAFSGTTCESDVDECEGDPCQNGGTCVNHLGGFTCHCARGFSGKHCHSDVDECWNIHCHNGGTCLNMQGAFYCSCTLGYEGEFCQEFVDPCASSPCVQGTCQNYLTGYACDCPFGVGGAHCEEESYGFPELSFLEFPSLDPRNNIISLELATVRQDSLLLYSHGRPGGSEFLALEIVGGRARLSFDLGSGPATVWTTKPVADGSFHSVTARRIGKAASLQVDSCSAEEPHGFCFSRGEGAGRERTLDVHTSNMTFGGIRHLASPGILQCSGEVSTPDGVAVRQQHVSERGVCRDYWSHHTCECGDLFTGTSCETEMSEDHALRLNGQAHIEYVVKESYRRDQQLKDWLYGDGGKAEGPAGGSGLEMNLRTTEQDGALLFILGRKGQATLKVMGGKLLFISSDDISRKVTEIAMDTPLVDSHWHTLHLFRERSATMILLDGHLVMNTTESTLDLTIANVHRMVLGADQSGGTTTQQPGFSGCVGYLRWDNWVLPFSGFSEVVEVRPSPTLTQGGCSSAGACVGHLCSEEDVAFLSCLSQLCPNGDTCALPPWVNGTCACLRNVTDGLPLAAGAPVWIVGVVVPTTFIVICLTLLVILRCKAGSRRKMQRGGRGSPARLRVKGGVDNGAFCGDAPAPDGQPIRAEKQRPQPAERPLQVCAETDPPSLQTDELEYYEIDSTCGASCSELRAPRGDLEGPRTTTETAVQNGGQRDPQDQARGDQQQSRMQAVLATPHPLVSENEPSDQQQTAVCSRGRKPCASFRRDCGLPTGPHIGPCPFPRRVQVPDLTGPPLGLSAEEVRRLNEPLDQQQGVRVATGRRHAHFAETSDSSDSESHSSFTCSVCGCEREGLSFAGEQACLHEHASPTLSGPRQGEPASGDTPSLLREDIPITEIQRGAESAFLGGPQHWERLLNLGLHFETYAQVFEDIARLPIELQHDLDWQSEAEEII
ncbi:hypothetical protein COCON_G00186180 [Conger conger]|uniref:Uncharacterized protein n=1 Tax=Conger conger TaxID=82655 RepID=A0A9Q1D2L5_CONCO|nr:hypothetical protein COCON_G00186180 [Conger conger]